MDIKQFEDLVQAQVAVQKYGQRLLVSVFFIDGLLIDTGPVARKAQLSPLFKQWEINELILTHHHEDHTGLASFIQENNDIPIYMHELGVDICQTREKVPFYRRMFWGGRPPFQSEALGKTYKTPHYTWDIIHTPGHSDDHIALLNKEKGWLFGGDLYVQPKPKSMFYFESVPTTIDSLRKVLTYDFDVYICSHAGVIQQGRKVISRKLNYLLGVQAKVLKLHDKGMSSNRIRKELFPKIRPMNILTFFESSPKHMIESILK